MTPEQWQNVREVLAQALELKQEDRSNFLDRVCSSDSSLRREVERLLSSSEEARSSFLQSSTLRVTLTPGTKLGDYEVLELIGSGGMGEVYRAHDARLRRDVAIKVLPRFASTDPDRLRRFEQEAQAAAALNHPNILAVYQMGTYEGAPYMVSELLEGCTLRTQLSGSRLVGRKVIDIATQIARGLAAAHEKRIAHRDLKPENLFITKDGRAKILDFGLAKLTRPVDGSTFSALTLGEQTGPGVVMGTVGYMSPEQVRGHSTDHRTDIFSFGAILYEMLTGKRAFQKSTSVETMNAILSQEPPEIPQLAPTVPLALQKVVVRCLDKNPEHRFQSASDLSFALEALSESGQSSAVRVTKPRMPHKEWIYAAIVVCCLIAAVLAVFLSPVRSALVPTSEWVQITDFADSVTQPAFSPDGRMLTFLRGDDTFTTAGQVYVMLLPHGTPVRLTNDSNAKMSPLFSPDGANIAYTVPWDTWTVPVLGGQPALWLPNASGLSWLDPDHLLFSQITKGNHMEIVQSDLSRARPHLVYTPEPRMGMIHRSYVSPDHKWVIGVEMNGSFWKPCRVLPLDGSSSGSPIGPTDSVCTAAAWSPDGKWMYLSASSGRGFHIFRQRFPNGEIQQVTSAPTEEEGIAFDPDGKSFVTAVGIRRSSVWLHDSHGDRVLTSEANAGLPAERNGSPFSPDGKKFYYLLSRTPGREVRRDNAVGELWEIDLQSGATRVVMPGFAISDLAFSPDGHDVAFSVADDEGTESIWIAPLDRSSSPRLLQASASRPRFTKDFIYYVKHTPEAAYAHRIRPDGSEDERIWPDKIIMAAVSPDGRYLAITVPVGGRSEWKLEIVDWARKHVQPVCNDAIAYWSDDGQAFFVTAGIGKRNKNAPAYLLTLSEPNGIPKIPTNGFSDVSDFGRLKNARSLNTGDIAMGPNPDTYAYVKETVQRNLYRIPQH